MNVTSTRDDARVTCASSNSHRLTRAPTHQRPTGGRLYAPPTTRSRLQVWRSLALRRRGRALRRRDRAHSARRGHELLRATRTTLRAGARAHARRVTPHASDGRSLQGVSFAADFAAVGSLTSTWAALSQGGLFLSVLTSYSPLSSALTNVLGGWVRSGGGVGGGGGGRLSALLLRNTRRCSCARRASAIPPSSTRTLRAARSSSRSGCSSTRTGHTSRRASPAASSRSSNVRAKRPLPAGTCHTTCESVF